MELGRPITDVIRRRSSFRTYDGRSIDPRAAARLKRALDRPPAGPFGGRVRLVLLESFETGQPGPQRLGTYGFIKGATNYIVGLVQQGDHALEDFGYVFEWSILRATELSLATCWVGGTLKRGDFARAAGAAPGEIVPAISPVGHAPARRRMFDSAVRWMAGAKKRKPWSELFFRGDFGTPLTEEAAREHRTALEMVRLAPSASNRQPWRIVRDSERPRFDLFLRRFPGYRKSTAVDLQRIDMGIAMCHFELTARELELPGHWEIAPPKIENLPRRTEYVVSWLPG